MRTFHVNSLASFAVTLGARCRGFFSWGSLSRARFLTMEMCTTSLRLCQVFHPLIYFLPPGLSIGCQFVCARQLCLLLSGSSSTKVAFSSSFRGISVFLPATQKLFLSKGCRCSCAVCGQCVGVLSSRSSIVETSRPACSSHPACSFLSLAFPTVSVVLLLQIYR